MKSSFGKLMALFLVLILALGSIGAVFAHWSTDLFINGVVNTGTVDAVFSDAFSNDDGVVDDVLKDSDDDATQNPDLDPMYHGNTTIDPSGSLDLVTGTTPRHDKDVADTFVTAGIGTDTLSVSVVNAYPSYSPTVIYDITNTGSIPVHVEGWWIHVQNAVTNWKMDGVVYVCSTWVPISVCDWHLLDTDGDGLYDLLLHIIGPAVSTQIDPETWGVDPTQGMFEMHLEQDAPQSAGKEFGPPALTFDLKVELIQWNKAGEGTGP